MSGTNRQMDIDIIYRSVNGLLMLVVCAYAIVRGDWAARSVGWTLLIGTIASTTSSAIAPLDYSNVEHDQLAIDLVALAALIMIVARHHNFWVIWITAFQTLSVAVHMSRFWTTGVLPIGYMFAMQFMMYPMLGLLAYATRKHRRRVKENASIV